MYLDDLQNSLKAALYEKQLTEGVHTERYNEIHCVPHLDYTRDMFLNP